MRDTDLAQVSMADVIKRIRITALNNLSYAVEINNNGFYAHGLGYYKNPNDKEMTREDIRKAINKMIKKEIG